MSLYSVGLAVAEAHKRMRWDDAGFRRRAGEIK